jgi:CheY-like chemotaxis protein
MKGIAIERAFQAAQSGLMGDPARFQQVMWNLLRNSVKYTPHGGHIAIRTSNARGEDGVPWLKIEVSDSGIGIEPEFIDSIFQAFEQGGLSGEHRFGGLGLGLSIARAIVDLHGGTIRAESAGAGHGATFIIKMPDATEPPHGIPESSPDAGASFEPASARRAARPLRLLVVEDHRATREVLKRLLTREGHHVVAAESVATALAATGKEDFDAVISDLGLPDGTGNELMAQLRERHGLRGIALSGYGMEKDTEESREAGFIAHLIKPVDFNQLRRALETLG